MSETDNYINFAREARSENASGDRLKELAAMSDKLAEIVANNVFTPPELLAELVSHQNKAVKKAVVGNPNNHIETLFKLGAQYFTQELLNNPILQLAYLENPDFINNLPFYTLHALLQLKDVPKFILNHAQKGYQREMVVEALQMHVAVAGEMTEGWHEAAEQKANYETYQTHYFDFLQRWNADYEFLSYFMEFVPKRISEDPFFKTALARNSQTSPNILEQLAQDKSRFMRATLAGNDNTPTHILRELADYSVVETREAVARNKNAPLNALRKLAKDKTDSIREAVARNENTPIDALEKLARDKDDKVRRGVAFNWNTSANILSYLASDRVVKIRQQIAWKENTSIDTLTELSIDTNAEVRISVAVCSTSVDLLIQLSKDESVEVRKSVARNENTQVHILNKLAKDKNSKVRAGVSSNSNLPLAIAEKLINDEDSQVQESFVSYFNDNPPLKILEKFATHPNEDIRERVAYNAKTTINILERLATDENYSVREAVARNKNTPVHILEQLAEDKHTIVCAAVAENENLPFDFLKQLASNEHSRIRYEVAKNPNTPVKILEILARDRNNGVCCEVLKNHQCTFEIKKTIFKNLAQSETPSFLRYVLFLSDYAKSSDLAENSNSISWLERYAIAQNCKTPKNTLQQLAQDGNRIVRATAKESLEKY